MNKYLHVMSFTIHSPPTQLTNINHPPTQHQPPTHPTSTNQPTNQPPNHSHSQQKIKGFLQRNQGVGPKHAKIQQSDHLTRSESVIGWIDGWEGGKPPSNWDVGPTKKPLKLGKFSNQIYYIMIVGWMLGMYFFFCFLFF